MGVKLISVSEAAERLGVTRQRILQLVDQGRIEGAHKVGTQWVIPDGATIAPAAPRPPRPPRPPRTLGVRPDPRGKR